MPKPKKPNPVVHVHGPRYPQDTIEIFGTTAGLERLINVLIEAVDRGRGRTTVLLGDGYEAGVSVACLDDARRQEEWRRSGSPYLDIEDPLVARIITLTDEVEQLRQSLGQARARVGGRSPE